MGLEGEDGSAVWEVWSMQEVAGYRSEGLSLIRDIQVGKWTPVGYLVLDWRIIRDASKQLIAEELPILLRNA